MLPIINMEVYPMKTHKSYYEQNGGTYMQVGDVLLPDLSIGEVEQRPIRPGFTFFATAGIRASNPSDPEK